MLHNIPYQRVDGGVFAQEYFQAAVLLLCLPDLLLGGSLIGKVVELIIQQVHRVFVEVQIHHTALVIDRTGGSIIYRLTHVVNIDVVAEHFLRVSVAVADRRSGEADKRGAWQGFSHLLAESLLHRQALVVPVLLAVLRAVRLVGHHDDVAAGGECRVAFFKLLNGGEDDSPTLSVTQQIAQVFTALGVLWFLTKEVLAAAELTEELVVEVLAVGYYHDGYFGQPLHQLVGVEHHGEALARTLRVPEHADFSVAFHCGTGALQGFAHGVVLVVGGKNLGVFALVLVEADEVLQNVEQSLLLEHAEEEGAIVGEEG